MATPFQHRVESVVQRIPEGSVLSYRDVAALAGNALAARRVGAVLRASDGLPWWRVVAADGTPRVGERQARRLRREGVPFRSSGKVDVTRARWAPRPAPPRRPRSRRD